MNILFYVIIAILLVISGLLLKLALKSKNCIGTLIIAEDEGEKFTFLELNNTDTIQKLKNGEIVTLEVRLL